jgi:hypothetical protein
VLAYKEDTQAELRLLHSADFRITQVVSQPGTGRLAMSMLHHGCSVIAIMEGNGGALTEITQGEAYDESPFWVPGQKNEILFQSAGVAHNESGVPVGKGPYSIQILNLDSMEIKPILEDPEHDLLAPKMIEDGTLYFIRRPYHLGKPSRSMLGWIEDLLLFPFRLLYAIVQFFNFFTMMYTGKPLVHSGPAAGKEADPVRMIIWGNLVEAQKVLLGENNAESGLVPANWELCRRAPSGEIEVLAKSVLSFDLDLDEGLLFTNGTAIYRMGSGGRHALLQKASMIRQVVALPDSKGSEVISSIAVSSSEACRQP